MPNENSQQSQTKGDLGTFSPPQSLEYQLKHNWLLVISIDHYRDKNIPDLHNCINDAEGLIKILTKDYLFKKENIYFLRSRGEIKDPKKQAAVNKFENGFKYKGEATHKNIITTLRAIAQETQKKEGENNTLKTKNNILIFYSGHGIYDTVFDEGYWVPSDANFGEYSSFIENTTIKTALAATDTHHTVLISDSCYSGSLFSTKSYKDIATKTSYEKLYQLPSRWGIAAGLKDQKVLDRIDKGDNHSPFGKALLDILGEKEEISVLDLGSRLTNIVAEDMEQVPICKPLAGLSREDNEGQFIFKPISLSSRSIFNPTLENQYKYFSKILEENTEAGFKRFKEDFKEGNRNLRRIAHYAEGLFLDHKKPIYKENIFPLFRSINNAYPDLAYKYFIRNITENADGIDNPLLIASLNEKIAGTTNGLFLGSIRYKVNTVAFSSSGNYCLVGREDSSINLFDVSKGQILSFLGKGNSENGHKGSIQCIAFSHDENLIITGSKDKTVKLWGTKTGELMETIQVPGDDKGVLSVEFSQDGNLILTGGNSAILWNQRKNPSTQKKRWAIKEELSRHKGWTRATFSPDGQYILTYGGDQRLILCEIESGEKIPSITEHTTGFTTATFTKDSQYILTGASNGKTKLWEFNRDEKNFKEKMAFPDHLGAVLSVDISRDNQFILTSGKDSEGNPSAKLWSVEGKEEIHEFRSTDIRDYFLSLAFSPDDKFILTGSNGQGAKLWFNPRYK